MLNAAGTVQTYMILEDPNSSAQIFSMAWSLDIEVHPHPPLECIYMFLIKWCLNTEFILLNGSILNSDGSPDLRLCESDQILHNTRNLQSNNNINLFHLVQNLLHLPNLCLLRGKEWLMCFVGCCLQDHA
jgi:hypothetical protein